MRRFSVATSASGLRRVVDVRIYPTARHMQRAARRHSLIYGRPQSFRGAEGVTSCYFLEKFVDGEWVKTEQAGAIFLIEGHITPEVAAHEATHMAVGIYDRDIFEEGWNDAGVVPDMPREEILCYLVGDITREILERA